jgi:hypothetical protein
MMTRGQIKQGKTQKGEKMRIKKPVAVRNNFMAPASSERAATHFDFAEQHQQYFIDRAVRFIQ